MIVNFFAKIVNELDKSVNDCLFNKMYFCVNEFKVGVNDRIFSGNEQQKVYYPFPYNGLPECSV